MKINVEKMVATALLSGNNEHIQAAEDIAHLALNDFHGIRVPPDEVLKEAERIAVPRGIARTGAIFVFERDDTDALASLDWQPKDLPPLPYPRCWFEVWDMDQDAPVPVLAFRDMDGSDMQLVAYALLEREQCAEWRVYGVFYETRPDGRQGLSNMAWDIVATTHIPFNEKGDAKVLWSGDGGADIDVNDPELTVGIRTHPARTAWLDTLSGDEVVVQQNMHLAPVALVQIIDTLGARHHNVALPRPTKRRFERRWGIAHPNIYFVDLRAAGDDPADGNGESRYRHRWMVRGHYRRDDGGRFNVPGKGLCTWVRPYIKGPAGAPWKGRPIYTAAAV